MTAKLPMTEEDYQYLKDDEFLIWTGEDDPNSYWIVLLTRLIETRKALGELREMIVAHDSNQDDEDAWQKIYEVAA